MGLCVVDLRNAERWQDFGEEKGRGGFGERGREGREAERRRVKYLVMGDRARRVMEKKTDEEVEKLECCCMVTSFHQANTHVQQTESCCNEIC